MRSMGTRLLPLFAGGVLTVVAAAVVPLVRHPAVSSSGHATVQTGRAAVQRYGRLPLAFEVNRGQADAKVDFVARGGSATLLLTAAELRMSLSPAIVSGDAGMLRIRLQGGDPRATAACVEKLPGVVNYFLGSDSSKWRTKIETCARAEYRNVFPGIGVAYYGNRRELEFDFVVAPGADPRRIALDFAGTAKPELERGELVLRTALIGVRVHKPSVYQTVAGRRRAVAGRFVLDGRLVSFEVGSYDRAKPLIIDPTFVYSTRLSGRDDDAAYAIAVDGAGNAYVTGNANSPDFPVVHALQRKFRGSTDVFVAKLSADGSRLLYATYLGGSDADVGYGIAVDSGGHAYVTGDTRSTDFPLAHPLQRQIGGAADVFVAKLSPDGTRLVYSTYVGGSEGERGNGIAVDAAGNAYVAGFTNSTNFPTANPIQAAFGGGNADAFVLKLNPSGSALIYSTYLGGGNDRPDIATAIAADAAGYAYVTGFTNSRDFPTVKPLQPFVGPTDVFVTKLNPTGSALVYSTHLGGSADDEAMGIAVDAAGSAYVTGQTESPNFPTTPGAFHTSCIAIAAELPIGDICLGGDAFVSKLSPDGSTLLYSTFLSGRHFEVGRSIAVDRAGNALVTGLTNSDDFPTANALQNRYGGGDYDAFVVKLNASGSALIYSTYLGGKGEDGGYGIAVDPFGNAYVAGVTESHDFPVNNPLPGHSARTAGASAGFVTKILDTTPSR